MDAQTQPFAIAGLIRPLLDQPPLGTWAADLVRQTQESALAIAKATSAHFTLPMVQAVMRSWTPPLIDVPTLINAPIFAALTRQATETLRRYADLAAAGSPRGRQALTAARRARDAYLQGRLDPVGAFVRTWLGLKRPEPGHVEAAVDALLDADLDDPIVRFFWLWDGETLGALRARVIAEARWHRPLRDGQIGGRAIAMLDSPLRRDEPDSPTLLSLVPGQPTPDLLGHGFEDARLERAWALLTQQERAVVLAQALRGGTWADAGVAAGYTAEIGETVRRKRARIAQLVAQRTAGAARR